MNDRDQIIAELETTQRLLMEARAEIARGKRRIAELRRAGERRRCAHRDEIARYHTDLVNEGIARLDAESRVAALDAKIATKETVINALRQAGDAEIARLTTAHRELAGDGLEIVREAIIESDRVAVLEAEIARLDNELEDWRATYRPKSALVKELEQAESRVFALKAENAHQTDEAVNEVWEDVLRCAQQAWPEKQS